MVEQFQSFDAMQDQVKHQQYHYHKVYEGDELVGYIGLQNQPDRLFLSKLYLKDFWLEESTMHLKCLSM